MALRSLMPFSRGSSLAPQNRMTDPFLSFRQEFDRLFDDFFTGTGLARTAGQDIAMVPSIDICETEDSLQVKAELPGVDEKDIDVELNGDILSIRGEKKSDREQKEENYHLVERSYGSFARSIRIPFAVDQEKVDASFDKGVLTITLPKPPDAQQLTKKISVKRGEGQQAASAAGSTGQSTGQSAGQSAQGGASTSGQ